MTERYDYAVVGLGALGSATAYELARRGHSVVGLEQFALGHDRGASHDTSRILRHSYHTPAYVRLTKEAYDDWAALEADSGETLVTVVGGLDLFPRGPGDRDGGLRRLAARRGRDRARAARRRPPSPRGGHSWHCRRGRSGLFQARGAIVPAGRGTAVLRRRAAAYGAVLRG